MEADEPRRSGFNGDGVWEWGEPEIKWAAAMTEIAVDVATLRAALDTDDLSVNGVIPGEPGPKELRAPVAQEALAAAIDAHDPTFVTQDRSTVPADGATVAVIAYRRRADKAPATVEFVVNGVATNVDTSDGVAELAVRSAVPRVIEIVVAGKTLIVEAK